MRVQYAAATAHPINTGRWRPVASSTPRSIAVTATTCAKYQMLPTALRYQTIVPNAPRAPSHSASSRRGASRDASRNIRPAASAPTTWLAAAWLARWPSIATYGNNTIAGKGGFMNVVPPAKRRLLNMVRRINQVHAAVQQRIGQQHVLVERRLVRKREVVDGKRTYGEERRHASGRSSRPR